MLIMLRERRRRSRTRRKQRNDDDDDHHVFDLEVSLEYLRILNRTLIRLSSLSTVKFAASKGEATGMHPLTYEKIQQECLYD